jgi:hypothetical protein
MNDYALEKSRKEKNILAKQLHDIVIESNKEIPLETRNLIYNFLKAVDRIESLELPLEESQIKLIRYQQDAARKESIEKLQGIVTYEQRLDNHLRELHDAIGSFQEEIAMLRRRLAKKS